MENNTLQVLKKSELLGQQFTVFGTEEEPLFLASDVARFLNLKNVTDMVSRVDEDELTKFNLGGQRGEAWFLTEGGLYEVLMQSRKPIAKEFKKGVKKILKEIRKTGRFEVERATSAVDSKLLHQKLVVATFAMEALHMSDVSRLTVVEPIARQFGVTLPDYVKSKGVLKSAAKELLRRSKSELDIRRFNDRMVELGYLEVNRRKTSKGVDKTFKTLTENGMEFGENLVSKYCPMETQPEYYSDKFETLLSNLKRN